MHHGRQTGRRKGYDEEIRNAAGFWEDDMTAGAKVSSIESGEEGLAAEDDRKIEADRKKR